MSAEHLTLALLYQLIAILIVTRIVGWIGRRFLGQTAVAGEILAGLALGPSVLGALFPDVSGRLFVPETSTIFVGFAQIGLILLMFQIGLEFQFRTQLGTERRAILAISLSGILVPFGLGFLTAPWFWGQMTPPRPDLAAFRLFFATAMSITAIPILGRIFMELGLSHTRTAAMTIGAAAIDDICGWILLGVVSTTVAARFDATTFALKIAGLVAFLGLVFHVVRPLLRRYLRHEASRPSASSMSSMAILLIVLLASASITSNLGVFAIIGAFLIGVALHEERSFVSQWHERAGVLVNAFFLPLFFTYTGLRTDIGSLSSPAAWGTCALVCLVAFAGKFGGAYLASRAVGERPREAAAIGVAMNTRALMELIALNIGYDLGVLPRQMFTMLVIMALASTFIATPLIRHLMSRERLTASP